MKKEEIIAGQIYTAVYKGDETYVYEAPGPTGYKGYMHLQSKSYFSSLDMNYNWTNNYVVRLATASEIAHFKLCEAAGKYVEAPKEEIINTYQLY